MLNCDPRERGSLYFDPPTNKIWPPSLNCDLVSSFHVELWPQVIISRWLLTPIHYSTLNFDMAFGSQFNVESWPGVIIQRWILTRDHYSSLNCDPGHNSTLKYDPGSWFHVELWPGQDFALKFDRAHDSTLNCDPRSWFHVELWPHVIIPRWIVTLNHDSTLNCDLWLGSQFNVEFLPGAQFNEEFWPVYISSILGIATPEGVNIQQRD